VRSWSGRACRCWSGIGAAGWGEIDIVAADVGESGLTLRMREHHVKASTIGLDAIGVVCRQPLRPRDRRRRARGAGVVFRAVELRRTVLLGEQGLDGRVPPVRGILPAALAAQQAGFRRVIVPLRQAGEVKLVAGIVVLYCLDHSAGRLPGGRAIAAVDPIEVIGDWPQAR
jgi:hypothetical protein